MFFPKLKQGPIEKPSAVLEDVVEQVVPNQVTPGADREVLRQDDVESVADAIKALPIDFSANCVTTAWAIGSPGFGVAASRIAPMEERTNNVRCLK
jgi:hypothetical protein